MRAPISTLERDRAAMPTAPQGRPAGGGCCDVAWEPRGPRQLPARKDAEALPGCPLRFRRQEASGTVRSRSLLNRLNRARSHPQGCGQAAKISLPPAAPPPTPAGRCAEQRAEPAVSRQNRVAGPASAGYVAPSFFFKPRAGRGLVGCVLTWLTVAGSRGARTCGWTSRAPSLGSCTVQLVRDSACRRCRRGVLQPGAFPESPPPPPLLRRPGALQPGAPSRTWRTRPLGRPRPGLCWPSRLAARPCLRLRLRLQHELPQPAAAAAFPSREGRLQLAAEADLLAVQRL